MNPQMKVKPRDLKDVYEKFKAIGGSSEEFHRELKETAKRTRDKARRDFNSRPWKRKGDPTSSNIRYKTIRRKKGQSAYEVTTGAEKEPVMAYIEFGTRRKSIDLKGVTKLFGSRGREIAARFKVSNIKSFTNRNSQPYFYMNAYNELDKFKRRMELKIRKAIKK